MSAQANIVAFDGASTPASHTLVPVGNRVEREAGVKAELAEFIAEWREAIATLPIMAQASARTSCRRLKSGVYRVALVVSVPTMEAIGGQNTLGYTAAPKVAFVDTFHLVGYFDPRSTIASRRLCRQLALNIGNGVATSVAPVVIGPSAELFDQLITAS